MEGGGLRCYFGFDFDLGAFSIGLIGHQLMASLNVFGLSFALSTLPTSAPFPSLWSLGLVWRFSLCFVVRFVPHRVQVGLEIQILTNFDMKF